VGKDGRWDMNRKGGTAFLGFVAMVASSVLLCACPGGVQCPPPSGQGTTSSVLGHGFLSPQTTAVTCSSTGGGGTGGNTCTSGLTPSNVLYTLDASGNILEYAISGTGSLTLMCTTATIATAADGLLAVSNNSSFLYVFDAVGKQIFAYTIAHGNTGTLTPVSGQPFAITVPQEGSFSTASFVQTDPLGRFLYVNDGENGLVYVFAIQVATTTPGALTAVQNSPFAVSTPNFVAVDQTGTFMFVADPTDGQVLSLTISATGQLTAASGSPFVVASGSQDFPHFVTVHPSNQFIYTANGTGTSGSISGYTFDSNTGELFLIQGTPVSTTIGSEQIFPGMLAIDSAGAFIYSTDADPNTNNGIIGYALNTGTGAVSQSVVPNAPYPPIGTGTLLTTIALNLATNTTGPNLYVLEVPSGATSAVVDNYPITIASGQLTPPPTQSTLVANNNMVIANVQ